jgi:hypothetical protein
VPLVGLFTIFACTGHGKIGKMVVADQEELVKSIPDHYKNQTEWEETDNKMYCR